MRSGTVFTSRIAIELHLRKSFLESHEIVCRIDGEALLSARPEIPAEAHLVVADPSQEDLARSLLAEFEASRPSEGKPWICPVCGEEIEPQFTACWKCGG